MKTEMPVAHLFGALLAVALLAGCCIVRAASHSAVTSVDSEYYSTNAVSLVVPDGTPFSKMAITQDEELQKRPGNFNCYKLTLQSGVGEVIASHSFAAHYGIHVDAIDLDGDGVPEFVVQAHIGPATGPAIKELTVLRFRPIGSDSGFLE